MKSTHLVCFLLLVYTILSGCASSGGTFTPIWTETQLPSPTSIPPTVRTTSTAQPTRTPSPPPPVTLEPGQAADAIRRFLQEPVNCETSCFFGITPGKTTLDEAKNIFIQLGINLEFTVAEGGNKFYSGIYTSDDGLKITPVLTVQDNMIKNIKVGITPAGQKMGSSREWSAYSPEMLIGRYGTPSKVNFVLDWGPQSFFEMDMYFDNLDLIVQYIVYGFIEETYPQVCPLTAPFEHISLWMGKDPRYPPRDIVLLEEATSLTLEEFSELMNRSPNNACFTLKEEAFQ
jgi:hypothetical protein